MKILKLNEIPNKWEYLSMDTNGRSIWIHSLKECKFTGHNLYYPNVLIYSQMEDKLYLPYNERTMSMKTSTIYEKNGMEFKYNKQNILEKGYEKIVENGFFFVYNTDNYYHFIYDTLPFLITYKHLKSTIPDLKLIMNYPNPDKKEFYKFILETLEIFNLENEIVIIGNENENVNSNGNCNIKCNNLYISTSYTHDIDSNLPPRCEIYNFYKNMVDIVMNNNDVNSIKNIPKKLYISRRTWIHNDMSNIGTNYTTRRKMENENELVAKLIKEGYFEIFTENMSMRDKIIYFNNATHIVGAIGGGICNVLFSKSDANLIALISPTFLDVNKRFKYSLECVNVNYYDKCYHTENAKFKKYMRVRNKEGTIYGEIVDIEGELLKITCTDGSNTGWNFNSKYDTIYIPKEDVICLDNGLNSNWFVDLESMNV